MTDDILSTREEETSQNLGGLTELIVVADIKPGLIDKRETTSYATRLRILLRTLNAIGKKRIEKGDPTIFAGPIEKLQTIYNVRWTIFDNEQKMLLAVVFDSPLEPYVRKLVKFAGPVLDSILCNVQGYEGHATDLGFAAFDQFIRRHQVADEYLGIAIPELTVDDMHYLKELEKRQRAQSDAEQFDLEAAKLRIADPRATALRAEGEAVKRAAEVKSGRTYGIEYEQALQEARESANQKSDEQALKVIEALFRVAEYYPAQTEQAINTPDHVFLYRMAREAVSGFTGEGVSAELAQRYARELQWFKSNPEAEKEDNGASESETVPAPLCPATEIQGNIVTPYRGMTHGCILLLRLNEPKVAKTFLQQLCVTSEDKSSYPAINIAFTYGGLKSLGLEENELAQFPREFREGMEARAGLIGDTGHNHPDNWNLPEENWPPLSEESVPENTVRLSSVDLVIQLLTRSESQQDDHLWTDKHPLYEDVAALVDSEGVQLLSVQPLRREKVNEKVLEHFGFADGISQPGIKPDTNKRDLISKGELFLGYENDRGDAALDKETLDPLLTNGTFLVMRKLSQDVEALEDSLDKHLDRTGNISRDELEAKLMGRYKDGRAIVAPREDGVFNDFDYSEDAEGKTCPFHSHIRRSNPRTIADSENFLPVPRIMRRGFSYGTRYTRETAASERGLMFMSYSASISEQFEVIQSWISGGNSTGVLSAQNDPLLGVATPGSDRVVRFVHDNEVVRLNLGDRPLVKLEWGMYLFVPSLSALALMAEKDIGNKPYPRPNTSRGQDLVTKFNVINHFNVLRRGQSQLIGKPLPYDMVTLPWAKLFGDLSTRKYAEDVWSVVRRMGGAMRTPYGVLVGDEKLVMKVFRDVETYSTRQYWDRMRQSIGELFLGMDPDPHKISLSKSDVEELGLVDKRDKLMHPHLLKEPNAIRDTNELDTHFRKHVTEGRYQQESTKVNQWIYSMDQEKTFNDAREQTKNWLDENLGGPARGSEQEAAHGTIKLQEFASDIIAGLAVKWFGLPNDGSLEIGGIPSGGEKPNCPEDFKSLASYFFTPNPSKFVVNEAQTRGALLSKVTEAYIKKAQHEKNVPHYTLFELLREQTPEDIARTMIGASNGFITATLGSFLSVMNTWIKSEDLWRHQQSLKFSADNQLSSDPHERADKVMKKSLIRAMQELPVPPMLHRTAVKKTKLGGVDIIPGERIVLGLISATLQQLEEKETDDSKKTEILFGGNYGAKNAPTHACSGQRMAFGVLLGMSSMLLEYGGTLRVKSRLILTLNERS